MGDVEVLEELRGLALLAGVAQLGADDRTGLREALGGLDGEDDGVAFADRLGGVAAGAEGLARGRGALGDSALLRSLGAELLELFPRADDRAGHVRVAA